MIEIVLYFAIWKMIYDSMFLFEVYAIHGSIDRYQTQYKNELGIDKNSFPLPIKKILSRFLGSIVFIILARVLTISVKQKNIYSLLIAVSYVMSAFGAALITNKNERSLGIIDFSWYSMMAIACGGLIFCQYLPDYLNVNIPADFSKVYYIAYHNETQNLLQKTVDAMLIVGSVLAVCMTIIWGKDIWRPKDAVERLQYVKTACMSMRMVIAYFSICLAVFYWLGLPLYNKMVVLREFIK
ncbi:hypothetical protein GF336_05665 [Candidatus Woesearchaeota archaeon]|nr:hypothetical protein [Candidatus Woesearchaeota archaeon]